MILFVIVTLVVGAILLGIGGWLGSEIGGLPLVIAAVVWIGLTGFFYWYSFGTEETVTITVQDKERITEGNDGKWMVYAADGETFEDTDAWFHGKTDSTDLYRALTKGETYRCKVNGKRIRLLSGYRNILKCEAAS